MIIARSEREFEPFPTGYVPAVCVNYFDVGIQRGYRGKPQHKLALLFELDCRRIDGLRFLASKLYTLSLEEKATLTIDLESWRGVALSPEELRGFELDAIKGRPCQLHLVAVPKPGGIPFVEIARILRSPKNWMPFKPETPEDYIPDWIASMIETQREPSDLSGCQAYRNATYSS